MSVFSIDEYRRILDDQKSTDEQVLKRIEYLESFCRNVIGVELEKYLKNDPRTEEKI